MFTKTTLRPADLAPGRMQTLTVDERDVLVCNVDGTYSAVHSKCTHYGAPLADGLLDGHRLVCPWHHACFDARTGRHLEAPGCDALVCYPVKVEGDFLHIDVSSSPTSGQVPNPMVRPAVHLGAAAKPNTPTKPYVVVGGGPAGAHAIEGIRQGGYTGPLVLATAEDRLPYDRTQVSKGLLTGDRPAEKMPLRSEAFYNDLGVEVRLNAKVDRVDAQGHRLIFSDGSQLEYAKACIATGSRVRQLDVPGAELPAVYSLRTYEDAEALHLHASKGKQVVVVGSSFIGMEAAMALAKLGCKVTVVSPEAVPFGKTFGARVGNVIQGWQEELGVAFILGEHVESFQGSRKVTGVKLKSGETITANLVVVGIGVEPNTSLIDGIEPDERGGIPVDVHGYAGHDLYVAGDIASAPQLAENKRARIEHWRVAAQQGTVAGNNMAGAKRSLLSVPYFWTNQAGHNLRYAGHHTKPDNIVFDGDVEGGAFIAYYVEGDRVTAALGHQRDKDLVAIHELMWLEAMPNAGKLNPSSDWPTLLQQAVK